MKERLKVALLGLAGRLLKRRLVFSRIDARTTAALSSLGFWYAGNVFDTGDIAYGISQNGLVEKEDTELVISVLDSIIDAKGTVNVFDIGANTGYYGILAGHKYRGHAKVHSFEPVSQHVEWLKQSIRLNRLEDSISVHEIALGNENKEDTIYIAGSGTSLNKEFIEDQFNSTKTVQVKRLDDIAGPEKSIADSPDFIKIDVEGYEHSVLEGAQSTLASSLPILYIEIAKTLKGLGRPDFSNRFYDDTFALLAGLGYEAFTSQGSEKIVPANPSSPFDGVRMYLFLHKDKHEAIRSELKT